MTNRMRKDNPPALPRRQPHLISSLLVGNRACQHEEDSGGHHQL
ncbi:MAG: hypothetical protein V1800_05290 [Candidatus Latescibacterota bacterium]